VSEQSIGSSYTKNTDLSSLKILLPYLWPRNNFEVKGRVALSLLFVIISKISIVWIPLFYKKAIDLVGSDIQENFHLITFFLIAYGMSRALSTVFIELKDFLFARVEQRAVRLLAVRVFTHLHSLSLKFHLDRQTGALIRTLERGSKAIELFFRFSTFSIIPTALEILIVVGTITYLYGALIGAVVGVNILMYVLYTIKATDWRAKFLKRMHDSDNQTSNQAVESLLNYETVKYFGNEDIENKRFEKSQIFYEKAAVQNKMGLSLLNTGQGIIISAGLVTLLWLVVLRVKEGSLTLGDLVLINVYLLQLYTPLNMLGFAYREIKRSLIEMGAMFNIFQESSDVQDQKKAKDISFKGGTVTFNKVSFHYSSARSILKNVSFDIPAGKKVALVGVSGSGKSTISRLLFRFYDLVSGEVLIDGQDIKNVTQKSLRSLIGVVPQDTILFNDTIEYNIRYGNPEASFSSVQKSAKAAHIHDFIRSLPQGYDTIVGERGLKLSGGEKQRISIARALLKRPKIFLFDESTSSLDTQTEKKIQENLNEISKNCTTLAIAHRLSTIADAYKILVLSDGEIVEEGSHQALLKKNGLYASMWSKQSQEKGEAT
jgi:ABC-type transport system involved in Fe-S cluster assembly fused permease/ATPase subunit